MLEGKKIVFIVIVQLERSMFVVWGDWRKDWKRR
jgi:hypothetical protein